MATIKRYCAGDIGSNSIKVRVVEAAGQLRKTLCETRYPIRLGASTFEQGTLRPEDIEATVGAFQEVAATCRSFAVDRVRVVATSAVREAANRDDLLAAVRDATGIGVEIISGPEEARLLAAGLRKDMQPDCHNLLIDIGGGSTEVIYTKPNLEIETIHSLRLGAVRLFEMIRPNLPISRRDFMLMQAAVENQLAKGHLPVIARKTHVLGAAGTMRALLDVKLARQGGGDFFTRKDLDRNLRALRDMTAREMEQKCGVEPRRALILVPGGLIVAGIMELYGIGRITVSGAGLRDGIVQEMIEEETEPGPHHADVFALRIGDKYLFDRAHGEHVAFLAARLFDELSPLHGLPPDHRDVLRYAAMLHDIGQFVSYSRHHKHAHYLLMNEEIPGLTPVQQQLLAATARYHRKSGPQDRHIEYAALPPAARDAVGKLAAILRIADALDREHRQLVSDVAVVVSRDEVRIRAVAGRPVLLELSAANRKAELFGRVFDTKVVITAQGASGPGGGEDQAK